MGIFICFCSFLFHCFGYFPCLFVRDSCIIQITKKNPPLNRLPSHAARFSLLRIIKYYLSPIPSPPLTRSPAQSHLDPCPPSLLLPLKALFVRVTVTF